MDNKTDLRLWAKRIRKNLDISNKSKCVLSKIRENSLYKEAKHVLMYYPKMFEINLLGLLEDDKKFYLPKVFSNHLLICPFKRGDMLQKSSFNVQEPCSNPVSSDVLDLILVPALMADSEGYRLGYGGGFYDRFIAENPNIKTILPIAQELCVDKLPHDDFDKKIDIIIKC